MLPILLYSTSNNLFYSEGKESIFFQIHFFRRITTYGAYTAIMAVKRGLVLPSFGVPNTSNQHYSILFWFQFRIAKSFKPVIHSLPLEDRSLTYFISKYFTKQKHLSERLEQNIDGRSNSKQHTWSGFHMHAQPSATNTRIIPGTRLFRYITGRRSTGGNKNLTLLL